MTNVGGCIWQGLYPSPGDPDCTPGMETITLAILNTSGSLNPSDYILSFGDADGFNVVFGNGGSTDTVLTINSCFPLSMTGVAGPGAPVPSVTVTVTL